MLGLLDCSKKAVGDFEEDHAVTAVKSLELFLTRFCTPLGRRAPVGGGRPGRRAPRPLARCDEELKTHLINTVRCIAADGAAKERRAVFLAARELFPNALIVIRDSAHAIRIASKALHLDEAFSKVWKELFDQRHALVPDMMNSPKWANLLDTIRDSTARVLSRPGMSDYPRLLAGVSANVAFAKQRFDSTAGPVAKVALMLLPIATLLAHVASDLRHDLPQRDRASDLLKKLDSRFCTALGVSADWGIICSWFLRRFDVAFHDIAKSRSEIDSMIESLDAIFVDGRVFAGERVFAGLFPAAAPGASASAAAEEEPLPPDAAPGAEGATGFITGKVLRNLRRRFVFHAGGKPVLLWGGAARGNQEGAPPPFAERGCLDKGAPPRGFSSRRRAFGFGDV